MVAVLRGRLCTHVALVVHDIHARGTGLQVLDINPGAQARLQPLYWFLEQNKGRVVKYYDDKDLSE